MLTLGIDSASRFVSVALLDDNTVLAARSSSSPVSATLLPMIDEMLRAHELEPREVDLVGVARGPGAYTGLRVGVVTAKVFGATLACAVVGVPTLDAMASQAPAETGHATVVLRAYKKRVVVGEYARGSAGTLESVNDAELVTASSLTERLQEETTIITDVAELLPEGLPCPTVVVEGPGGVAVAVLARDAHMAGAPDETASLAPRYVRPPSITLPKKEARR